MSRDDGLQKQKQWQNKQLVSKINPITVQK